MKDFVELFVGGIALIVGAIFYCALATLPIYIGWHVLKAIF